jgi:hypothetical protein
MAFNPIIGKDFSIWVDSSVMFYAESFDLSMDRKEIEVTNLSSQGYDEFLVGSKGWTASINALRCRTTDTSRGFDYLQDNFLSTTDASLAVSFRTPFTGTSYVTGAAWLTGLKQSNGGLNSTVTYSANLKGTGPLAKSTT